MTMTGIGSIVERNGEAVITGYIGVDTTVSVPSMLGGHVVTSISSEVLR